MSILLTTDQLAEYLQVTNQSIYNYKKQGMPYVKVGSNYRYEVEKVLNWMKEKENNKQK